MANRSADFNYKVALGDGLKALQRGRLRQAEEQFRYLVQHFPAADGGYRGLAKVFIEQADRPAALRTLLDGGAALAKAGDRGSTIAIYKEAVALDPHDLTSHRRLAAALTLAGDTDGAAHEYVRFVRAASQAGDADRAKLEIAFALERLPGNGEVAEVAREIGAQVSDTPRPVAAAPRDTLAAAEPAPLTPERAAAWDAPASWEQMPAPAPAPMPSHDLSAPAPDLPASFDMPATADIPADADASSVEAMALAYLRQGDARAGNAAIEAARRYIADGHIDAASDLLLQLIAAGISDHDAQRLLVDVTKSLGKRELTSAKVALLVQALRLDGRNELAAEVEQLAQAS